ncbi:HAD hydrolase [Kwoniella mangroviensis CBS 10435]|uniref:HAD hydrolase n=1 Tax=Kwoniella mangroviensis CBS 10435 TaxID=1331196 RepID=A0A1B9IR28_9TREE|nr:HAD hydrolase [Kwoniella mangroviensis CBS 10435]OCF74900.1 HAD hydrolase [Kwoniella mangroviensis CBS 8886]
MSKNHLKLKALLIDLNGTLHLGSEPTKGAVQAIEKLRKARIPFIFCSNSTKESSSQLLSKLGEMGFRASQEELMTSLSACRQLVEEKGFRRPYLIMSESAKSEFPSSSSSSSSKDQGMYDSVILGLDPPSLSYDNLNKAFRILKSEPVSQSQSSSSDKNEKNGDDRKAVLIAPHKASFQQSPSTSSLPAGLSLGIGPFVHLLEHATGERALIVGKPTKSFFELAIQRLQHNHGIKIGEGEIGVIGDDIQNDLGEGARELGLKRILVRTGKYRPESEQTDHRPDKVYEDFAEFVDDLI